MTQPLHEGVAAFCLCFYRNYNYLTGDQVVSRWQWMEKEAKKCDIKIVGYSADGDTRLLKPMKLKSFPIPPEVTPTCQSFVCNPGTKYIFCSRYNSYYQ